MLVQLKTKTNDKLKIFKFTFNWSKINYNFQPQFAGKVIFKKYFKLNKRTKIQSLFIRHTLLKEKVSIFYYIAVGQLLGYNSNYSNFLKIGSGQT